MYSFHFGSDLQHSVGRPAEGGSWESDGNAGTLAYGPYVPLRPGSYSALVKLYKLPNALEDATFELDVVSNFGADTHLILRMRCRDISAASTPVYLDFELKLPATVEVRVTVTSDSHVGIRELTIFCRKS